MSKIALNSNASGTGVFTIASPNSDTDRTLNLPDESGTVVSENASGNVAVTGDITSNGNAVITTQSPQLGRRNLIINGAMQVAQRGTSSTGIVDSFGYTTVDRVRTQLYTGTWTSEQSTDAPDSFAASFKLSCTTGESAGAADVNIINYRIEAQDLQQLAYGASGAKTMTLSFWVKSNKTGTASLGLTQEDNSSKLYTTNYSISSSDTWEYKTVTIAGDTAGVINNDTGDGLIINWWLNSGSNYTGGSATNSWETYNSNQNPDNLGVGGTTSDYFAITGVQLEVGDVATPFEHRSYGEELTLCKRYFETSLSANNSIRIPIMGSAYSSSTVSNYFEVEKRAAGTLSLYDYNATLTSSPTSRIEYASIGTSSGYFISASSTFTNKTFFFVGVTNTSLNGIANFKWTLDAEL